ncbi:MAG: hypothetical protein HRU14_13085 [Planctomycetes bacterium]|nr:hypothetical protein [Planctomycetota bacterium]
MRSLCGVTLLFLSSLVPAQIQLSFEGSAAGASITGSPDAEGWSSIGGTVTVVPFGAIAGPTSQFPTDQPQWCIIRSAGAVGSLATTQGGPAPYPIASGTSGMVRNSVTVPFASPGQQVTLSFDFNYVSQECAQATTFNDWCAVDLVDPATGLSVLSALYRDTWSIELVSGAVTPDETGVVPIGACTGGALEENLPGTSHSVSVVIPAALHGSTLNFEAHVADSGDGSFSGFLYLDNVQIQGGMAPPPPMTSTITTVAGAHTYSVDAPATAVTGNYYELYTLVSLNPAVPTGSGAFLGMHLDAFMAGIFSQPLGAEPFHVQMTGSTYSWGPFTLPPGLSIDWLTVGVSGGVLVELTAAQTKTF